MAALSTQDRTRIFRGLMRYWSAQRDPVAVISKNDLYNPSNNTGAVADADNWADTHGGNTTVDNVGFNGALAAVVRNNLSTSQKGILFMAVVAARTGNMTFVRQLLGEVD